MYSELCKRERKQLYDRSAGSIYFCIPLSFRIDYVAVVIIIVAYKQRDTRLRGSRLFRLVPSALLLRRLAIKCPPLLRSIGIFRLANFARSATAESKRCVRFSVSEGPSQDLSKGAASLRSPYIAPWRKVTANWFSVLLFFDLSRTFDKRKRFQMSRTLYEFPMQSFTVYHYVSILYTWFLFSIFCMESVLFIQFACSFVTHIMTWRTSNDSLCSIPLITNTIDCNYDRIVALLSEDRFANLGMIAKRARASSACTGTAVLTGLTTSYGSLGCFCTLKETSVVLAEHKFWHAL